MEELITNSFDEDKAASVPAFSDSDVLICAAKRTPLGAFLGQQSSLSATDMGAAVVAACAEQAGFAFTCDLNDSACDDSKRGLIEALYMGCVLPAGLGQAPARQTALFAGLPQSVACTTINKVCGSGMKSAMLACDEIRLGQSQAVIAGGMESMSNAPHLLPSVRAGQRFGHGQMLDHLYLDGLEDAYSGRLMGCFADDSAEQFDISREQMDGFALHSLTEAKRAINDGDFSDEIVPLTVIHRGKESVISQDEAPFRANEAKIPTLKPAFGRSGRVTAANASSMADGAAALLLMSGAYAKRLGVKPLAKVLGQASHARAPSEFTQAPVGAISKLLTQLGWSTTTPDLYEINEAFAMVTLLAIQQLDLDPAKVNVHGGACALGHPLGATGARILVTLLHALRQRGGGRGIASLCIGGGEATAMAIETL
ncbi:acetyl-CoA C-acyltransferase [Corallincola luteus]|uniref:Acetyl-CoA C-acyltransferase n=1 Tax=Corallincola luteus TaxID=1775177 RepID=A0ABY2AH77_9GAMM|nr:acetyl-CoA C-acyltransferase [Corallincola luteus]TCI01941.1 acetyl-CoA C-acyltransferase [Corallincola luteus]